MKTNNYKLYAFVAVLCCINSLFSVNKIWTGATSNAWGTSTNWSPAGVPATTDDIEISGGSNFPIAIPAAALQVASFTISTGSINIGNNNFLATSVFTISGGTFTAGTGTFRTNSNLVMTGGTFTKTSGTVTVDLDLSITTGSFSPGTSTMTVSSDCFVNSGSFTKTSGNINVTADFSIFTGATFSLGSGILDVNGDLSMLGGVINANSGDIDVLDDIFMFGGTLNGSTSDILSGSEITISGGTFNVGNSLDAVTSIIISGGNLIGGASTISPPLIRLVSGAFSMSTGTLTVNYLVISGGSFNRTGTGTNTINQDLIISSGRFNGGTSSWTINDLLISGGDFIASATNTITVADSITIGGGIDTASFGTNTTTTGTNSTITVTAGTVIFGSNIDNNPTGSIFRITGGTVTAGTGNFDVTNMIISGGTLTKVSGNYTISQDLTISNGTFTPGTGTMAIGSEFFMSGTGVFTKASGNITIITDFNMSGGTVDYGSTSGTFAITFGDFIISGGTFNLNNNGSTVDVNGDDLLMSGGVINNSGTIDIDNDFVMSSGTFTSTATSDVVASGGGAEIFISGGTFNLGNNLDAEATINFTGGTITGGTAATNIFTNNGNNGNIIISSGSVTLIGEIDTDVFQISGGTVNVGTTDMDINSNMTQTAGIFTKTGGTSVVDNNLTISGGTFNAGTATWSIENLLVSGSGILNAESSNLAVNTNITISGGTVNGGTSTFGSATATNLISVSAGTVNASTATLNAIDITLTGGTLNAAGDKINLRSGSDGDLRINGGTLNVSVANMFVEENMIMQSGTLDMNNLTLTVEQDYTYLGGTITDASTFFLENFIVSQSGNHTMNYNTRIAGSVTFSGGTGLLITSASFLLIFDFNATVTGVTNTRHVAGPVRKEISTTFNGTTNAFAFPIGDGIVYAPITISDFQSGRNEDFFTAQYDNTAAPFNRTLKDGTLDHIGAAEYWMLDRGTTSGTATTAVYVLLSYASSRSGGITATGHLRITKWDGSTWKDIGTTLAGGSTTTSGAVRSTARVTVFSPFTIASTTGGGATPLPVSLLNFDAKPLDKQVKVSWSTSSEINNDFFTVQKSIDGKRWSVIGIVNGIENSTQLTNYSFMDRSPVNGIQYYRLIQTDINGKSTISNIVSVNMNSNSQLPTTTLTIFPNPANKLLNVSVSESLGNATIVVYNSMGMRVLELNNQSGNTFALDISSFENGIYTVEIRHENGVNISKILKN